MSIMQLLLGTALGATSSLVVSFELIFEFFCHYTLPFPILILIFFSFPESLRDQRYMIKGFKRKIIDVANTLNMTSTVIRLIERRSEGDKWVLFGGMAVVCLLMFFVIRWYT